LSLLVEAAFFFSSFAGANQGNRISILSENLNQEVIIPTSTFELNTI